VHLQVHAAGDAAWTAESPGQEIVMARIAHRLRSFTGRNVELARTRSDGLSFLVSAVASKRTVIRLAVMLPFIVRRMLADPRGFYEANGMTPPEAAAEHGTAAEGGR
jgi:hypothetical protein